jgi:hypothetical protein
MGRDNQAAIIKLGFIGVTLSSPDHWLVDNANQCTHLVGYLVSNGCNALARLFTDTTPPNPQDVQESIPNLTSQQKRLIHNPSQLKTITPVTCAIAIQGTT